MKNYKLRITLSDFSGAVGVANYSTFKILNNVNIFLNFQFVMVFERQVVVSTSGAIQLIRDTFRQFLFKFRTASEIQITSLGHLHLEYWQFLRKC